MPSNQEEPENYTTKEVKKINIGGISGTYKNIGRKGKAVLGGIVLSALGLGGSFIAPPIMHAFKTSDEQVKQQTQLVMTLDEYIIELRAIRIAVKEMQLEQKDIYEKLEDADIRMQAVEYKLRNNHQFDPKK